MFYKLESVISGPAKLAQQLAIHDGTVYIVKLIFPVYMSDFNLL